MNNKFDILTKGMAQSVTRRGAFRKFGVGLAGMALSCFGLTNHADPAADKVPSWCDPSTNLCCCRGCKTYLPNTHVNYYTCKSICGNSLDCPGKQRWV
jgi:hypothetical protein